MSEIVGIREQRLERAQSEHFVENFLRQALALLQVHRRGFADDERFENLRHFAADVVAVDFGQAIEIQLLNQLAVNRGLDRAEVGSCDLMRVAEAGGMATSPLRWEVKKIRPASLSLEAERPRDPRVARRSDGSDC